MEALAEQCSWISLKPLLYECQNTEDEVDPLVFEILINFLCLIHLQE